MNPTCRWQHFQKILDFSPCTFTIDDITLTHRETQCLTCLILGMTVKEIGKVLALSPRTVEGYINNLKTKLNSGERYKIIIKALAHGFPVHEVIINNRCYINRIISDT